MLFSVIYSADTPADVDIHDHAPPQADELWEVTEDDGQFECEHLGSDWEGGHYRKWCAVLNREQFDDFIDKTGLSAEHCETMGSIGAPGFGYSWAPAISFTGADYLAIQNAYVTPVPEIERAHPNDRDWDRVRAAVLSCYG